MKRTLPLVLVLIMVLVSSASAVTLSDTGVFPLVDEACELSIWVPVNAVVEDYETNEMTKYYEDMTGVHVNWIQVGAADVTTKLNLSISSGDYPDIYTCNFSTAQVTQYSQAGIFQALDGLIDTYGDNIKSVLSDRTDIAEAITLKDGHIYTLFATDPATYLLVQNKLFINNDWLKAYCDATGKEAPVTTQEFEDMLVFWKENDVNGNGEAGDEIPMMGTVVDSGRDFTYYLLNAYQVSPADSLMADDEGNVSFTANTEEYREGLKWVRHLYEQGLIAEETFIQDNSQLQSVLNKEDPQQRIVGAFGGFWQGTSISTASMPGGWDLYSALPPIEGPTGLRQCATSGHLSLNLRGAITSACENPALALKWLDYWFSNEGMILIDYGFENVNWEWNETPAINGSTPSRTFLTGRTEPQNVHWYVDTVPYYRTEESLFGRTPTDHVPYLYEGALAYEDYYTLTGFPQFAWCDDNDLLAENVELQTQINEYVKQAKIQFITGLIDINDDAQWENYLNQLQAMNLDRYLEVVQIINFGE